jgi:hypothetical protein
MHIDVVASLAKGLQFLKPNLLKEGQFVINIEVRIILDFHYFQDLKNELLGAKFALFLCRLPKRRTQFSHLL